jgi:hypothetical protein
MRRILQLLPVAAALFGGAIIGGGAAWYASGQNLSGGVGPGPWRTSKGVGEASSGLFQRAVVARIGLWALPASEVVYFNAVTDSDGQALSRNCTYEISADRDPPTRWWSITLYRDNFWVDNPADRYSFASSSVAREPAGGYRVILSATPQAGNWLPMGDVDGEFVLAFRNYQPEPVIAADPEATPLPTIRRLTCG